MILTTVMTTKVRPFIPCAGLSGSLQRTIMSNAKSDINQSLLNYIFQRASRWLFLTHFEKKSFFSKCVEVDPYFNAL